MTSITTTRSDMRHLCALFVLFVFVVAVSSLGGLYLYIRHAKCPDLGYGLAQLALHFNHRLDANHDGIACNNSK